MTAIHPTAVVDRGAELSGDVEIGPFCVVGANAVLGAGVRLHSHVVVEGRTPITDARLAGDALRSFAAGPSGVVVLRG